MDNRSETSRLIGLIGSTGLIGSHLQTFIKFDRLFNSTNIDTIVKDKFSRIYCAAPSGNRVQALSNPADDTASVDLLISKLEQAKIDKLILISTGDTQIVPDSVYGRNRLRLEECVKQFNDHHIIRLSSLISNNITKNVLYDIKHQCYLDKINPNARLQWYPLCDLEKDLDRIISNNIRETNLCSEPILIQEIIDQLAPQIKKMLVNYTLGANYDLHPYSHLKEDILKHMRDYLS